MMFFKKACLLTGALLVSGVSAEQSLSCFNYSPFHSDDYYNGNVQGLLDRDFSNIKGRGVSCIKTFYTQYFGNSATEYAVKHGLKIVLGVFMNDPQLVEAEVGEAIKACKQHPDSIVGIVVGNENLTPATKDSILGLVDRIRGSGCTAPLGTAQTSPTYMDGGAFTTDMAYKLDFMGVSLYSFFGSLPNPGNVVGPVKAQMDGLRQKWGPNGGKFIATEVGWPSAGAFGSNVGSFETAQSFINQLADLVCSGYFGKWIAFFELFDENKKAGPVYEQNFGLLKADGSDKLNFNAFITCSNNAYNAKPSAPAPAPSPAPTPAPGTPPPAPTPAPTAVPTMQPISPSIGSVQTSPAPSPSSQNTSPPNPPQSPSGGTPATSGQTEIKQTLCQNGMWPVSVEAQGTFCAPFPICTGGVPDGNCPGPQQGLQFGSSCKQIKTGVPGCVPNKS